ncbi:hypothetical protein GCM10023185_36560 [Hymenobacter saemangeumensis]|uniref:RNA polymerase sigma-70 region 2 domain-containing protein n=1 Tax=Hymenobacter saemangeumensis TaxID=1084522 RepID=A0ABP8IQ43_9BACT
MLRRLRIVAAASEPTACVAQHPRLATVPPFVLAVARQYPDRGLSLVQLAVIGEAGWLAAQRHYGADTAGLARWGTRWARERILQVLGARLGENPPPS